MTHVQQPMTDFNPNDEQHPDWDWKKTIIVFGRGDIPPIDDLAAAERAAVAVLQGDRSLGRFELAAKTLYSPPSAYVDECVHCGQRASAHMHAQLACPEGGMKLPRKFNSRTGKPAARPHSSSLDGGNQRPPEPTPHKPNPGQ